MRLTHQQANALLILRAKLDPTHAGFTATMEIRRALETMRPYLDSYVIPMIDFLEGNGWHGQARDIQQQADRIRLSIINRAIDGVRHDAN
jgi:hypothetical protein